MPLILLEEDSQDRKWILLKKLLLTNPFQMENMLFSLGLGFVILLLTVEQK